MDTVGNSQGLRQEFYDPCWLPDSSVL